MKQTKHIIAMFVLAGLVSSGAHAVMHHDPHHHAEAAPCRLTAEPCQCHPCESPSCAEEQSYPLNRTPDVPAVKAPAATASCFVLPADPDRPTPNVEPPCVDTLMALRTVQLLI